MCTHKAQEARGREGQEGWLPVFLPASPFYTRYIQALGQAHISSLESSVASRDPSLLPLAFLLGLPARIRVLWLTHATVSSIGFSTLLSPLFPLTGWKPPDRRIHSLTESSAHWNRNHEIKPTQSFYRHQTTRKSIGPPQTSTLQSWIW